MASLIAKKAGKTVLAKHLANIEPADPLYEEVEGHNGQKKRVRRTLPPGLSKRDQKILMKIKKRAHYLDKGMNLCGFRVGWTFFIGIIPGAGDVVNAILNYTLVLKPSKNAELPDWLVQQMWVNNAVSGGVGFIPFVGDLILAVYKANSRNAHLLEEYLAVRGQEYLASQGYAVDGSTVGVTQDPNINSQYKPGAGLKPGEVVAVPGQAQPARQGGGGWFGLGGGAAQQPQQPPRAHNAQVPAQVPQGQQQPQQAYGATNYTPRAPRA